MCYDTFHSVHNSKYQAYLALTSQLQSEPVDKEQSRITRPKRHALKHRFIRNKSGVMMTVISAYVPRVVCLMEEKDKFRTDLDEVVESIYPRRKSGDRGQSPLDMLEKGTEALITLWEGMYGAPFSHLFTELKIYPIEVHISAIELEISPIQLKISAIELQISPNRPI